MRKPQRSLDKLLHVDIARLKDDKTCVLAAPVGLFLNGEEIPCRRRDTVRRRVF